MYLIFVSILVAAVAFVMLLNYGSRGYKGRHFLAELLGIIGCGSTVVIAIIYACALWSWTAADYKAQIINREYGTSYTQSEVFYASDVIETVRQLDRKRYEINGDLVRGKSDTIGKGESHQPRCCVSDLAVGLGI